MYHYFVFYILFFVSLLRASSFRAVLYDMFLIGVESGFYTNPYHLVLLYIFFCIFNIFYNPSFLVRPLSINVIWRFGVYFILFVFVCLLTSSYGN